MSTKIYWAYRFKRHKWIEFIDLIHDQMFVICLKHVKRLMNSIKIDEKKFKADIKKYGKNTKGKESRYRKWVQLKTVLDRSVQASDSPDKDYFDLDCAVNFWIRAQHVYAIPICPDWMKKYIKFPDWVEDYSYWDNVDPPEDISMRAWDARGEMWEKINCGNGKESHNARRLCHDVVKLYGHGAYVSKGHFRSAIFPEKKK